MSWMTLFSFESSRACARADPRWRVTRVKCGTAQALALKLGIFVSAITASFGQGELPSEVPDTFDLTTALSFALDNNFNIRRAIERIEEQEGIIVEVKARTRPSLTLNADYQRLDEGLSEVVDGFGVASDNTWGISLNLRQALYQGGGIKAALKAQDLTRESVRLFLESTIMDAMLEVTTRYYGTLLARDQIVVEEQNIELLEETLEDVGTGIIDIAFERHKIQIILNIRKAKQQKEKLCCKL